MKLLVVSPIFPPEIGGPATYTFELAKRLSHHHQVTVVAFSHSKLFLNPKSYFLNLVPITGNGLFRQLRLFREIFLASRTTNVIYAQGTVVVGLMSLLASRISHVKLVVKFVGDEIWENEFNLNLTKLSLENFYAFLNHKSYILNLKIWLHRFVLHHADAIIAPSVYLRNFLIHTHQVNPSRLHVISNAINPFSPFASRTSHLLVTVGRLVKTKNIDIIIKALALARQEKPWKLVIIGDGPERQKLEQQVTSHKLQAAVAFLGALPEPEVAKHVACCRKLILMSNYEGQSHTLLRALEQGTPIIASNIEPNRELLGDSAILVPPDNPEKLSVAINTPQKPGVKQDFSWEKHIKKLLPVLSL